MVDIYKSIIENLGGKNHLDKSLHLNLNWIKKSLDHNNGLGSSAFRRPWGTWASVYPETTGYLIPTLINAAAFTQNNEWISFAKKQVSFLKSIQNVDGSFYKSVNDKKPIVFDTAQILVGLCFYDERYSGDYEYIEKTYHWLLNQMNDEGLFIRYNYVDNYNPSYYSRILWPMLWAEKILAVSTNKKIETSVQKILGLQNSNGSFNNWSFNKEAHAFTHSIVYTLRGLWECAPFLPHLEIVKACISSADALLKHSHSFSGSYDQNFEGDNSFVCSAGNAQWVILLDKIYKNTQDLKYLNPIADLMQPLLKAQRHKFFNKGAIPSSIPISGKYQKYKYTNWTQKFFTDALLVLLKN